MIRSATRSSSIWNAVYEADPEHVPTVLELIGHYRKASGPRTGTGWLTRRFSASLMTARSCCRRPSSAVARKAYKKAAGFARRLLKINPINPGVRRQMIELQVAHARKQMRAKRPDLAAKELAAAAEWERPDAPSGLLRIARGLVGSADRPARASRGLAA